MAMATSAQDQRQYPRFGLGVPVSLHFGERDETIAGELQDISCGGCFFKSRAAVAIDRRISLVLAAASGRTCRASGRVVRTMAYTGFAVLFDDDGSRAVGDFIKTFAPLSTEGRLAYLSTELRPEIEIF